MQSITELKPQQLIGVEFIATVVNNNDPLKKARVQVRIPLIHDDVANSDLPWARSDTTLNGVSVPQIGKKVSAYLDQGRKENPVYGHEIVMANSISGTPLDEDYPNTIGFYDGINWILLNKIKRKVTMHSPNSTIVTEPNGIFATTSGNAEIVSGGDCSINSGGNIEANADGDINATAGGNITAIASGNIVAQGTMIFLN